MVVELMLPLVKRNEFTDGIPQSQLLLIIQLHHGREVAATFVTEARS